MKNNYILKYRCFGYKSKKENKYYAFCVDLNLTVQGDSAEEIKSKLAENIDIYLNTVLENQDDLNGLFPYRKAPFSIMLRYYIVSCLCKFSFWCKRIKDNYLEFTQIFEGKINNYKLRTI